MNVMERGFSTVLCVCFCEVKEKVLLGVTKFMRFFEWCKFFYVLLEEFVLKLTTNSNGGGLICISLVYFLQNKQRRFLNLFYYLLVHARRHI